MTSVAQLSQQEAERFLYREARLLDERAFEAWLDLFTPDGVYWVPIEEGADPETSSSLIFDNAKQRYERVYRLLHTPHYAQMPPSRTVHHVSNVLVEPAEAEREVLVRSSLLVSEVRPGHRQQYGLARPRSVAGLCEHRLRYEDGWRIALKKVLLIERDVPMFNLTFIV